MSLYHHFVEDLASFPGAKRGLDTENHKLNAFSAGNPPWGTQILVQ